jgi:SAM-dependent methyltransferase
MGPEQIDDQGLWPGELLESWIGQVPRGWALDLGTGSGRTAAWLVRQGFWVEQVESNRKTAWRLLADLPAGRARLRQGDMRRLSYQASAYSLIVAQAVLHFIPPSDRKHLAGRLITALVPGGWLIAEAFLSTDPASLPGNHPLQPGELKRLFAGLEIMESVEERRLDARFPAGYYAAAGLAGRKPA